jgi:hypothetical protein
MKTLYTSQHDYIRVTVVSAAGHRLNLTRSFSGGKISASQKNVKDADALALDQAFEAGKVKGTAINAFLNMPNKGVSPLKWMEATKACGETATDMVDFLAKLPVALVASVQA